MASKTVEALRSELKVLEDQIQEIQDEHEGVKFPDDVAERWDRLNKTVEDYKLRIELQVREERIQELKEVAKKDDSLERGDGPYIRAPGAVGNPYDLSNIPYDRDNPEVAGNRLKEHAKVAIDRAKFQNVNQEDAQEHVSDLVERVDSVDGSLARRLLVTGDPVYRKAFGKYLMGQFLTNEESKAMAQGEERALSLTGASGGFAVPFQLDPSIIPTSNLAINPYRSISRVIPVSVDEWRGVSSAGVSAAYAAEATAASDNAPTLAQPTISTEKAQAFIPFSIEVGMDWSSLQAEMGALLSDAKDELEALKFTLGSGTNEPFGVVTGATSVYTAAATNALVVADIYGWQAALGARFRPNSKFLMHNVIAQKIRQFDTQGGASLWIDNLKLANASDGVPSPGAMQAGLLGKAVYESTSISSALTTGQLIGVYGDFNYYVIIDRIGLSVETIPHLFDVTNNRPTGQRGLYAYWRNGAKVVDAAAFRTLKLA